MCSRKCFEHHVHLKHMKLGALRRSAS
jgi:hypothetical protein